MTHTEPVLTVQNLSVTFPDEKGGITALHDVTFSLSNQEFLCVLGPSGSGKSALLRVLSGLVEPTSGSVQFSCSQSGEDLPRIGYVFQEANLMPWRTAIQNIMLPLELRGIDKNLALRKAQEWIQLVGLQGFEDAWPRDLSGGMAMRVAIARALIQDPDLLLLDEPFGALDALTREHMGAELLRLWQNRRQSVIMVTHSISEALLLADRIVVLTERPGHICLDLKVDLPRPRGDEIRYDPQFIVLTRRLRSAIE